MDWLCFRRGLLDYVTVHEMDTCLTGAPVAEATPGLTTLSEGELLGLGLVEGLSLVPPVPFLKHRSCLLQFFSSLCLLESGCSGDEFAKLRIFHEIIELVPF